ncbi:putative 2-succinyl-6-hydroxy-2,4-cyclohexadiene-1-carboxylate synthase [Lysinibacillus alkalisoli]|uniref:Putative 2-succinyl-6-hydroxy-2,4-cyclohexadiene-1-carboxylate synthase n=1 Tax=Lysinibacillus alkalisoli TaxID=1911548 RepID=A0A917G9P8_9BACI|nr:2-succinyl-6-hydroxy-2,4-cyclohexadiene-1-carboxylate synthase [Lysinibacillus alkalisoli]GGG30462.1 putative 2-succinyl-6-hydroxy-2,4-cyclohexadiene-1-carboxylate synthase [Lysinibacillus alkalisoli]
MKTLVCLHGFTGSEATWYDLADDLQDVHIIAFNLYGHGKNHMEERYTMEDQIDAIHRALADVPSFALMGYSMGGRTALCYAAKYPEKITQLFLESASPGLKKASERAARRVQDEKLACMLEHEGLIAFVDYWQDIALFHTQKQLSTERQQQIRTERLSHEASGLAMSLRCVGTGSQPSMWGVLPYLQMPVTLLTGALDDKFCVIAEKMLKKMQNAKHIIVEGAGHAIHVEKSKQFATIVEEELFNKEEAF